MPASFRKSIPDNFRALLTAMEKEFDVDTTLEFVYDICPECRLVYRLQHACEELCPKCCSPRYMELPNGKRKARLQVCWWFCVMWRSEYL